MLDMEDNASRRREIEELCKRIEALMASGYLSENEKLKFAREALKILVKEKEEVR